MENRENLEKSAETSELSAYSGLAMAYLGDSVIELLVRERLVTAHAKKPSVEALKYVTAQAQSDASERILPLLTEEEESFFKRGRNAVHSGVPKSATPAQYRRATGLESLFGYLHIAGRTERIRELFAAGFPELFS